MATANVNFGVVAQATQPWYMGVVSSTYGTIPVGTANVLDDFNADHAYSGSHATGFVTNVDPLKFQYIYNGQDAGFNRVGSTGPYLRGNVSGQLEMDVEVSCGNIVRLTDPIDLRDNFIAWDVTNWPSYSASQIATYGSSGNPFVIFWFDPTPNYNGGPGFGIRRNGDADGIGGGWYVEEGDESNHVVSNLGTGIDARWLRVRHASTGGNGTLYYEYTMVANPVESDWLLIHSRAANVLPSSMYVHTFAEDGNGVGPGFGYKLANPWRVNQIVRKGAVPNTQAVYERNLDARYVRIPVRWNGSQVVSSAGGSGFTNVKGLVSLYQSWGYHVLIVIAGRTNDFDGYVNGDAAAIKNALGTTNIDYQAPNEPNNGGHTIAEEVARGNQIASEIGLPVWGPVWTNYQRSANQSWISGMGANIAGVDYHHYAMGSTSISTAQAMTETPSFGAEVREAKADLLAAGRTPNVNVDEMNFSWRYQDGTPGGNNRFFTAINTVWMASVTGHVLASGGRAMPYATQNGPLGLLVEPGAVNPDGRAANTPMPGYWGVSAWTGASTWSHMRDSFFTVNGGQGGLTDDALVECWAVNNEAGGYNIVVVNKSEATDKSITINLSGVGVGVYDRYQSRQANPYDAPVKISTGVAYTTSVTTALPAMTVTVVQLKPNATTPTPPPATTTPTVAVNLSTASGVIPLDVVATLAGAAGTNPLNATPYAVNWGDGTATTAFQASGTFTHTYVAQGVFTVTATVRDNAGTPATGTATKTVTASTVPAPASGSPLEVVQDTFSGGLSPLFTTISGTGTGVTGGRNQIVATGAATGTQYANTGTSINYSLTGSYVGAEVVAVPSLGAFEMGVYDEFATGDYLRFLYDASTGTLNMQVSTGTVVAPPAPPPAGSSGVPAKVVPGYLPQWKDSPRLRDLNTNYNMIILFSANPVGGQGGSTGAVVWNGLSNGLGANTFINADIKTCQSRGQKIILSVGGAGNQVDLTTRARSQAFVDSLVQINNSLGGIDGFDWNTYEGRNPLTAEYIWVGQELKRRIPGCIITTPPAPWNAADRTFCRDLIAAGALDLAMPQYYDGPGLAVQSYIESSVVEWANVLGGYSNLVVLFGYEPTLPNYMTPQEINATYASVKAAHPTIRGGGLWQIYNDYAAGYPIATTLGPKVYA